MEKMVYGCKYAGNRINFNAHNYSLCHEAEVGVYVLGEIDDFSLEAYNKALKKHFDDLKIGKSSCINCSKCYEHVYDNTIRYITINTSDYCNSSCVYCSAHSGVEGSGYNPIYYLEQIKPLLHENCYFDWGGGEPTLNPYFEIGTKWISENGYRQRINTNGIIFSYETFHALEKGNAVLRLSIDAGTRECFERIKGHVHFDDVWENIRKYRCASGNIYLKYNMFNMNSDKEQIDAFLNRSKDIGIKHLIIDAEISCYQPRINAGPFYFTEKEFNSIHYYFNRAKEMGFEVEVSGYAFSVRPEYDDEGNLTLPHCYFDNIDKQILKGKIFPQVFPTINSMLDYIDNKRVVVFGAGKWGKALAKYIIDKKIKVEAIIDNNSLKIGDSVVGLPIVAPEEYYKEDKICYLVIGVYASEQTVEINTFANSDSEIIWVKVAELEKHLMGA